MGVKLAHRQPQVYQLLLSRVIDVKYGSFTFFSNFKAGAVWPREGNTRLGEEASSPFLIVRLRHFFFRPSKKGSCYAVYDWLRRGDLRWNVYARVKARNEPVGDAPGAGEIKVPSRYTASSVMSSKMRKSRHIRKFQTRISSRCANYIVALFDNAANQRAPGQLKLDNCTRPSP